MCVLPSRLCIAKRRFFFGLVFDINAIAADKKMIMLPNTIATICSGEFFK